MKYHINKHGVPAVCRATEGNCPLGGEGEHFDNIASAQKYADKVNSEKYGALPTTSHSVGAEDNNAIPGKNAPRIYDSVEEVPEEMNVSEAYNYVTESIIESIEKHGTLVKSYSNDMDSQIGTEKQLEEYRRYKGSSAKFRYTEDDWEEDMDGFEYEILQYRIDEEGIKHLYDKFKPYFVKELPMVDNPEIYTAYDENKNPIGVTRDVSLDIYEDHNKLDKNGNVSNEKLDIEGEFVGGLQNYLDERLYGRGEYDVYESLDLGKLFDKDAYDLNNSKENLVYSFLYVDDKEVTFDNYRKEMVFTLVQSAVDGDGVSHAPSIIDEEVASEYGISEKEYEILSSIEY